MRSFQHAFTGGEYAPELHGRTDLDRYELGAAELTNFVVRYSGGVEKRLPLRFGEFLNSSVGRLLPFQFSDVSAESYIAVFGASTIHLIRNGVFLTDLLIEATFALEEFTAVGHGLTNGQSVRVLGRVYIVTNATANNFKLVNAIGVAFPLAAGAYSVRRLRVFAHPYSASELREIVASQRFTQMRITHPAHPPYALEKIGAAWSFGLLATEGALPLAAKPTITSSGAYIRFVRVKLGGSDYTDANVTLAMADATGTGFKGIASIAGGAVETVTIISEGTGYTNPTLTAGGGTGAEFEIGLQPTVAGFAVAVSAVKATGQETGLMEPRMIRTALDFTQTAGTATYTWSSVAGAVRYNVYRTLVQPDGQQAHIGYTFGYIGSTIAPSFTDINIVPDFTDTPRRYRDPFAPGQVLTVTALTGGANYTDAYTSLTITSATGSGFVGYPIFKDGAVIGVYIANPGTGYDAAVDTFTLTTDVGTGATFSFTAAPLTGTYPALSFEFQQRTGFAGSYNDPMTLWVSQAGEVRGFGQADTAGADDPYEYELDSAIITPIRHVVPAQQGLLIFTAKGVSLLRAGEGQSVTALNAVLDHQSFVGAATVPPVEVEEDVIYIESRGRSVRLLIFNGVSRKYDNREISLLARHLFPGQAIRAMAFALPAQRTGYIVFEDGSAVAATIDRVQETFAFTPIWTDGFFRDVVFEDLPDRQIAHFLVERVLQDNDVLMWETVEEQISSSPEDQAYLDSMMETARTYPAGVATISALEGVVTVTSSVSIFSNRLGQAIWLRGGRGVITAVGSGTSAEVTLTRPIIGKPRGRQTLRVIEGLWWVAPFVTEVSGIPHEGALVSVVGDGKQQNPKVVTGGAITLDEAAAVVQVGFSYAATLRTLPISEIEGIRLRITGVELLAGVSGPLVIDGYEYNTRTDEPWNEPGSLVRRAEHISLGTGWLSDNSIQIESDNGLPCEIRRIVFFYEGQDDRPRR